VPQDRQFIIRPYRDGDKNFIYATWLRGLYYGNDWYGEIHSHFFFRNYQKIVDVILNRPNVVCLIACLPDEPDVALGYSVLEGDKIHWVFTKHSWRANGIARALVPQDIKFCSHLTKIGRVLKRKYSLIFNPFIEEIR
jgi:GNAT superfamily N-acetyltransferase